MNLKASLPFFAAALLLAGAGGLRAADPAKAARLANTVFLDETGVRNLRLQTVEAEEQTFEETLFALGRIEVLPGKRATLSSRIAGRALKVLARPDHAVRAGEPLIVIESRQPGEPPPQITLVAPMDGLVVDLAVAPGDPVSPDKALLGIVDLSTVYALARVPEHPADRLRPGQAVRVTSPGWPGETWETRVEHLGAVADPVSGTLEVACHVNNEGTWLRPGMRAEFNLVTKTRVAAMAVPRSAVQGEGANRFVFVVDESVPNAFVRVPVVVNAMNDRFADITQGLLPGDRVVTTGAYSLAFAGKGSVSLKEALDAAHGHEHNEDGSEVVRGQKSTGQPDDHDHDGPAKKGMSPLTLFSLIGNAVLLGVLLITVFRRGPTKGGVDHAQ